MLSQAIRKTLLVAALGVLPAVAAAQATQAGDNGRQPVGADSDSPRQAIPNQMTNDGTRYYNDNRVYYQTHDPDRYADRWLRNCELQPLAERPACRDAVYQREHGVLSR